MCQMLIRTFISIDVPITDEISEVLESLKHMDGIRASPKEQIHITLKFLGDTDEKKVIRLCDSLEKALSEKEPFDITISGTGAFPNQRNPRVVWLGTKDPEQLVGIADTVNDTVSSMNLKCDDKKFSPHITIGRVNGRCDLKGIFNDYSKKTFCTFRCDHIDVMKSVLTPKGAIHSVVRRIWLNGHQT